MRYLRPISRRLLPDDMLVLPSDGQGGYGDARMVRGGRGVDDRDVVAKTLRRGAREADRLGREQQRRATAYARARGQL